MAQTTHRRSRIIFTLIAPLIAIGSVLTVMRFRQEHHDFKPAAELISRGATLFRTSFTLKQGLGPLFNQTSCVGCHATPTAGGMGREGLATSIRVARVTTRGFDPMTRRGGPVARLHSVVDGRRPGDLASGIPAGANVTSVRNAPDLHGVGLIDAIPDQEITAGAVARGDGIHGHPNWVRTFDGRLRIGRFGWKADVATLRQFIAEALRNELGITNPLAAEDLILGGSESGEPVESCPGKNPSPEDDGTILNAITAFVAALPPPRARTTSRNGAEVFRKIRCDACHTPGVRLGQRRVRLYSDLLLHDVGAELNDSIAQGEARGSEWRTTPLWGLGGRMRLLHDGRSHNITEAILAHGGEAMVVRQRFEALTPEDRSALLEFLKGL